MNKEHEFRLTLSVLVCLSLILLSGLGRNLAADTMGNTPELLMTHGMTVGSISREAAVIWSRANRQSWMHVRLMPTDNIAGSTPQHAVRMVRAEDDFTGKITLTGLVSGTRYNYTLWFSESDDPAAEVQQTPQINGSFTTLPQPDTAQAVRFAWGGDLAGQNVCRDQIHGFPIFNVINRQHYDFFIGLGDMIYADALCDQTGLYGNKQIEGEFTQSMDLVNFWAHWKYNREDKGLLELLASVPYYSIWDDHEVVNDFGPHTDIRDTSPYTPGQKLMPLGRKAYQDYNPVIEESPDRFYRAIRMGRHLELILLDNRQYRDPNIAPDHPQANKSMLGAEQLAWLQQTLAASTATWKIIVSSVPVSIPTGATGRDGWANFDQDSGFESELWKLLEHMRLSEVKNIAFITTDIHFATGFHYRPFISDPEFGFYEFITGPLNAGAYLREEFDTSFNPERLYLYGSRTIKTFEEAIRWFNFGEISIDEEGKLHVRVINGLNETVYDLGLEPRR
jgi:alkaline phosphatase D